MSAWKSAGLTSGGLDRSPSIPHGEYTALWKERKINNKSLYLHILLLLTLTFISIIILNNLLCRQKRSVRI